MTVIAVTGHRPKSLGMWNRGIHDALDQLRQRPWVSGVVTGMALG